MSYRFKQLLMLFNIVLVVLVHSKGANAALPSQKCVISVLEETLLEIKKSFIDQHSREMIGDIFSNSTLTKNEKARKAFELVLAKRLSLIPKDDAQIIWSTFQNLKTTYSKDTIDGYYLMFGRGHLAVTIPEQYSGTAIEYFTIAHELEHGVQHYRLKGRVGTLKRLIQEIIHPINTRFLQEEGAMRAEWAFLQSIPQSERKKMITEVMQDAVIKPESKKFLLRTFSNADSDADIYIQIERKAGRYSKKNIAAFAVPASAAIGATSTLMGMIATLTITSGICIEMIGENGTIPETSFFKDVCLKLAPVRRAIDERKR